MGVWKAPDVKDLNTSKANPSQWEWETPWLMNKVDMQGIQICLLRAPSLSHKTGDCGPSMPLNARPRDPAPIAIVSLFLYFLNYNTSDLWPFDETDDCENSSRATGRYFSTAYLLLVPRIFPLTTSSYLAGSASSPMRLPREPIATMTLLISFACGNMGCRTSDWCLRIACYVSPGGYRFIAGSACR